MVSFGAQMNNLPNPNLTSDLFGGRFKPQFIRVVFTLAVFTC